MMTSRHSGVGGGDAARIRMPFNNARYHSILSAFFIALLLCSSTAQAQVGYGPRFDPCGDNCQTALLHFCTQLRDAKQQSDCWCGVDDLDRQYTEKMDACLATCDPAVSRRDIQRDMILRYRRVVCKGSAEEDEEFQIYYEERYGVAFTPKATAAAPPPPPAVTVKPSSKSQAQEPTSLIGDISSRETPIPDKPTSTLRSISSVTSTTSTSTTASNSPTPTSINTSTSDSSRSALDTGEITGISIGAVATIVGLISIFIILRRRKQRHDRDRRHFANSPASHDEYVWSPISPATAKSHTPDSLDRIKQRTNMKRSIYDFLGWKPQPSGLDFDPHFTSEKRGSSPNSARTSHEREIVPTIRLVSPGGANRRLQISPPMMMSGASAVGGGIPASSPPPKGPLPPPPGPSRRQRPPQLQYYPPRFIPSVATSGSGGTASSIHDRPEFILPPFPAPPTNLPPHAITTPSGMPPPDFGRFVHPYAHGNDPTRLSAISQVTDMDLGRMSSASLAESACSQQTDIEDEDSDSEWTDYNDCRTEGTETLERRARLDDLFRAVEAGYRGTYAEDYGDVAQSGVPPITPGSSKTAKGVGRSGSGKTATSRKSAGSRGRGRKLC